MKKLLLKTSATLQGDFTIQDLNLLLVFQVNCPGCFLYALPLANYLSSKYTREGLNILGLSTAFEDFELNTAQNTELLLKDSKLVGETKKIFNRNGFDLCPIKISFPVAFDLLGQGQVMLTDEDIELFCQNYFSSSKWNETGNNHLKVKIKSHLFSQSLLPYTFTMNKLLGTPSWILFDAKFNILREWFGHQSEEIVAQIVGEALKSRVDIAKIKLPK